MPSNGLAPFTAGIRGFFLSTSLYIIISVYFLLGVITSSGSAAPSDWGIPLTASAAVNDFRSLLYAWQFDGYGSTSVNWGFPFFPLVNAVLAPLGLIGGMEIKITSVSLIALSGISINILANSFGLRWSSSFLAGLFYMTTAVEFNWLMFGFVYYSMSYALLPLLILSAKKFLETYEIRYALLGGILVSISSGQPTFILVCPVIALLFCIFESKVEPRILLRGFIFTGISILLWVLTGLSFLVSINTGRLSFYEGGYFGVIQAQFMHLGDLFNSLRLWGSTFNYQFETYFPKQLTPISFLPVLVGVLGILLRPRDRRLLFSACAYFFAFASYEIYHNLQFLVYNIPYGSIFEAPSIFLVPAALGLALLIGYANETVFSKATNRGNAIRAKFIRNLFSALILVLIVLAGATWWTGQASGSQQPGPPVKLNLYQVPSDYFAWSNLVEKNNEYFVLNIPQAGNVQIANTSYFSGQFEGVNNAIINQVNTLPYISPSNSNSLLVMLFNKSSQVAVTWGAESIKYVVVYTNALGSYNVSDVLKLLSNQTGIIKIAVLPDVIVYQDQYAKPIIYASNATTRILYQNPTQYKVSANSTSPFVLLFNQIYSNSWSLSVNGTILPSSDHIMTNTGFNGWRINQNGTMNIDIYYRPQATYFALFVVSIGVLFTVISYLVFTTVRDYFPLLCKKTNWYKSKMTPYKRLIQAKAKQESCHS